MPYTKDPGEKKDYGFDWTARLDADAIASSSWAVDAGLTVASPAASFTTTTTTIWLSGGTDGVHYNATNHIITAGGREHERTFVVQVADL